MEREEHLKFCKKCTNRMLSSEKGFYCGLTNEIANFDSECDSFILDKSSKFFAEESPDHVYQSTSTQRTEVLESMRENQNIYFAIISGAFAALLCAIIWAVITVSTGMQIGFMALGVGLVVGYTVQFFGAGVDGKFGIVGAIFSLLGCVLGNLFSQVGFAAEGGSNYLEILDYWTISDIMAILGETFSPVDLLFYAFAVAEGYKFGFVRYSNRELKGLSDNELSESKKNYKFRKITSFIFLVIICLFIGAIVRSGEGARSYTYESGAKLSEGDIQNGLEEGPWTFFYESGEILSKGHFKQGVRDGEWMWYDMTGALESTGNYIEGIESGVWNNFYSNGKLRDSGAYENGRMQGVWKSWYENNNLVSTGEFNRGQNHGLWHYYYDNGKLMSKGNYLEGITEGKWNYFYKTGLPSSIIIYNETESTYTVSSWDVTGKQTVNNGNGMYSEYDENNLLVVKGNIENGNRTGVWTKWHSNGNKMEEGEYNEGDYTIVYSWDASGNRGVVDGNGTYESLFADGKTISEKGPIIQGLKEGNWTINYETGNVAESVNYKNGKLHGKVLQYNLDKQKIVEGTMKEDKRQGVWTWYHEEGRKASEVEFVDGKKEGKQETWDYAGNLIREEMYKNGEQIK